MSKEREESIKKGPPAVPSLIIYPIARINLFVATPRLRHRLFSYIGENIPEGILAFSVDEKFIIPDRDSGKTLSVNSEYLTEKITFCQLLSCLN